MLVLRRRRRGFTLIEVLVSMAIFGVLSVLAYQALGQTFFNAEELGQRMDRLQAIQRTMRLLGRDLMQTAPRPIRDPYDGPPLPAIRTSATSSFALELTHGGWPNPAGLPRSTLQRVAWRIEDGELVRLHWGVLDATLNTEPVGTILLDGVVPEQTPDPVLRAERCLRALVVVQHGVGPPNVHAVVPGQRDGQRAEQGHDQQRRYERDTGLSAQIHGATSKKRRISPSSLSTRTTSATRGRSLSAVGP